MILKLNSKSRHSLGADVVTAAIWKIVVRTFSAYLLLYTVESTVAATF